MKLRESFPCEFYVSDSGYLVLKGDNKINHHDAMIYMSPDQVAIFAFHFDDLRAEQKAKWTGVEE